MTHPEVEVLVEDYIARLEAALSDIPDVERRQLVSEVAEHIDEERATLAGEDEAAVRAILDHVGDPECIGIVALASRADAPDRRRGSRRRLRTVTGMAIAAVVVLGVVLGIVLSGTTHARRRVTLRPPQATVQVPDVVGDPVDDAVSALRAKGLGVTLRRVRGLAEAGGVVGVEAPPPGSLCRRGSHVDLSVSPSPRPPASSRRVRAAATRPDATGGTAAAGEPRPAGDHLDRAIVPGEELVPPARRAA